MNKRALLKKEGKLFKAANIRCFNTIPILIFPIIFLYFARGIFHPVSSDDFYSSLCFIVFSVAQIYFLLVRKIINNIKTRKYGTKVKASVRGYHDVTFSSNAEKESIIELSAKTSTEEKIICFPTIEKYEVGSEIELLIYNNNALIVDDSYNKIERIHNIIIITLLSFIACIYLSDFIVYRIINTTYQDIKKSIILATNKKIMTNMGVLEYNVPSGYKLIKYEKDLFYDFESKNDKHYCDIQIYSKDATRFRESINECSFNEKEKIINGSKWCYNQYSSYGYYYFNDGKNCYTINLNTHLDIDEQCALDFSSFLSSLKVNNQ